MSILRSPDLTPEKKFQLLQRITSEISGTLDLDRVLNRLLEIIRSAVGCDAIGIFVLNRPPLVEKRRKDQNLIAGMSTDGFPSGQDRSDPMLRSGKGIVGHVIQSGDSVVAPDVRRDPRYIEGRPGTLSEIAVPIHIGGQVIGALNLESNRLEAFSESDLDLLRFCADAAAICIDKAVLHRELSDKQRMESQLRIAHDVQMGLLPQSSPDMTGYDMGAVHHPTMEIGGDYYDFIPLPDARWGLAIADVSGKGMPAALLMATFRAALRSLVLQHHDFSRLIQAIHLLLIQSMRRYQYVTAFYGVLEPGTGTFSYVNCGHNPPLILRRNGGVDYLKLGGPVLGMFHYERWQSGATVVNPGDLLALYTDGVVEVTDDQGQEFGLTRMEELLARKESCPAAEITAEVVEATRAFSGSEAFEDDFTLVILKREPVCRS